MPHCEYERCQVCGELLPPDMIAETMDLGQGWGPVCVRCIGTIGTERCPY